MVVTGIANQPRAFSDQIVAYGSGVANTSQSSIIVEQANTPVQFSQAVAQYSPTSGNIVVYTTV